MNKIIAAPIDEKNVSTDWIEDVFDGQRCVQNDNGMVGFIDGCPTYVFWRSNLLFWILKEDFPSDLGKTMNELKHRLSEFEDPDTNLFSTISVARNELSQRFYFKED